MAGPGGGVGGGPQKQYAGKVTGFVLVTCIVAAMGGLIFGYDLGISGGVTSMDEFLRKFFPAVYHKEKKSASGDENMYCRFDSQLLTLFTSSLYLAALAACYFAAMITKKYGRKVSMLLGGVVFLVGSLVNGIAINIAMLIIGRILLGVGVGFANQAVPVYLSEMAPAKVRGALNMGFQIAITLGILIANLVNYGTAKMKGGIGWRVSVGVAGVPAVLMTIGAMFLPDTPNSMLARGKVEEAKRVLLKIRGVPNVDEELNDLIEASEATAQVENPWRRIMEPKYRPQLVFCIFIPFFQQMTGINVIMFYAPVFFKTLGFGDDASLMSSVITGVVNVVATTISVFIVDKVGRRALFLEGGVQMFLCYSGTAIMLILKYGESGQGSMSKVESDVFLFLICAFVAAFAWSWGPLGWLVPTEVCSLEVRPSGQAINVAVNMIFTFAIAQAFLAMLCHLKFGLFFFFAGFVVIMSVFVYLLLPETKGVPIEDMNLVFKAHWFWNRYIPDQTHDPPSHARAIPV